MSRRSAIAIVCAMTDTPAAPPETEPPTAETPTESPTASWPDRRLLYRSRDDRVLTGVCAALGRWTDTDPLIWRILTVVLAITGGAGIVLYLVGLLLIPSREADGSLTEPLRGRSLSAKTVVLLAVLAIALITTLDDGDGLVAVAVVAGVGYLVYRDRTGQPTPTWAQAGDGASGAVSAPVTDAAGPIPTPAPWQAGTGWPTPAPRAPRRRSRLGPVTLSLTALVAGALVLARTYGADGLTPARILAASVIVVGAGLVIGTWYGRARWLAFIGVALCLALGATAALDATGASLRGGVGERYWMANQGDSDQDFRLGAGEATLDLRGLDPEGAHINIDATVGLGHLLILLPTDLDVRVRSEVALGEINGDLYEGAVTASNSRNGQRKTQVSTYGSADPRVEVDATVGTGEVEIRRG